MTEPLDEQTADGFGWSNMFLTPEDDPRTDGGFRGERETLVGFLRDQRLTFELKCSGLDAEQLARRAVPPSTLSLLGLVRHLAAVEQGWFRLRMAGTSIRPTFGREQLISALEIWCPERATSRQVA